MVLFGGRNETTSATRISRSEAFVVQEHEQLDSCGNRCGTVPNFSEECCKKVCASREHGTWGRKVVQTSCLAVKGLKFLTEVRLEDGDLCQLCLRATSPARRTLWKEGVLSLGQD